MDIPWPFCDCSPTKPKSESCTLTGHRVGMAVRRGLYAHYLRLWLRYHRPEDLLIFRSEDFFEHEQQVQSEVTCFARPSDGCRLTAATIRTDQQNSASKGREGMWESTEQMLKKFYATYNVELDALLGRKMSWWCIRCPCRL